jgi:hypothetical protein
VQRYIPKQEGEAARARVSVVGEWRAPAQVTRTRGSSRSPLAPGWLHLTTNEFEFDYPSKVLLTLQLNRYFPLVREQGERVSLHRGTHVELRPLDITELSSKNGGVVNGYRAITDTKTVVEHPDCTTVTSLRCSFLSLSASLYPTPPATLGHMGTRSLIDGRFAWSPRLLPSACRLVLILCLHARRQNNCVLSSFRHPPSSKMGRGLPPTNELTRPCQGQDAAFIARQ